MLKDTPTRTMWIMQSIKNWLRKFCCRKQIPTSSRLKSEDDHHKARRKPYEPVPEDYPKFPPPPPQEILQDPAKYWATVTARKYAAPRGVFEDSSLYALYRLYECIVLDKVFGYRNILGWFWRQHKWPNKEAVTGLGVERMLDLVDLGKQVKNFVNILFNLFGTEVCAQGKK